MTTPDSLKLLLLSKVRVLVSMSEQQELEFLHERQCLSTHDDELEIFLESAAPAMLEICDFEYGAELWKVTATTQDGSVNGIPWDRGDDRCQAAWGETESAVRVDVTATSGTGASKIKPIFIKVSPEGARPWP